MSQWITGVLALAAFVALAVFVVWVLVYEANFAQACEDLGGISASDRRGWSVCVQGVTN